jgi:ribosomal 50S subunit-recycling heat shock protein
MTQPRAGGGRSRIVIDVERMQAEARARKGRRFGRAGRYLSVTGLVVIAVVLVLLVGGYLWWRSFERSPAYSLALLVDAARRGDNPAVESLINADQIAGGFVPQVIEKLTSADSPVPPPQRQQLTSALPQLLPRVNESVRDEVAQDLKTLSKGHTSFLLTALAVESAADVREQGGKASVTVKAGDRPVELTMARDGERWKVVTVKDEKLAADIAARLASDIPAPPQPAQTQGQAHRRGGR